MDVLVIGGTGNISSSVVAELLRQGHEVFVAARGSSHNEVPDDVQLIACDRYDMESFRAAVSPYDFDAVIDMISFTPEHATQAVETFQGRVGQYIHCSTAVVYGTKFESLPVREDHPRLAMDVYGSNKAAAEDVLWDAHEELEFPVTILRPSQTYGRLPLLRQVTGWDPRFLDRLRKGKPVTIADTADRTLWCALHVDDAAVAFAGVVGQDQCIGQAYNVVGDELYTWANYHRKVARAVGVDIDLVPVPLATLATVDDPLIGILHDITAWDGWFDNSALRRDVPEFHPRVGLEEGIRDNVEYLDKHGLVADSSAMTWEDDLAESITARW